MRNRRLETPRACFVVGVLFRVEQAGTTANGPHRTSHHPLHPPPHTPRHLTSKGLDSAATRQPFYSSTPPVSAGTPGRALRLALRCASNLRLFVSSVRLHVHISVHLLSGFSCFGTYLGELSCAPHSAHVLFVLSPPASPLNVIDHSLACPHGSVLSSHPNRVRQGASSSIVFWQREQSVGLKR